MAALRSDLSEILLDNAIGAPTTKLFYDRGRVVAVDTNIIEQMISADGVQVSMRWPLNAASSECLSAGWDQ